MHPGRLRTHLLSDPFGRTSGIFYNFFHHYAGAAYYELFNELYELNLVAHKIEPIPFSFTPLIVSVVVALGGLFLGWWVYGRNPLKAGEQDPLERWLGPAHVFLNNKWYWDELYNTIFYRPTVFFSERVAYEIIDKGIIDGILHAIARFVYWLGGIMKWFEETVISGGVDWVKDGFLSIAEEFRYLQTGKVQEYALISVFIAGALAIVILLINSGWLAQIF